MDRKIYHRRSLVETVISSLKRKYGSAVSSRAWWRQFREMVAKCLVYTVERALKLLVTFLVWLWFRLLYSLQQRISTEPVFDISLSKVEAALIEENEVREHRWGGH